MCCRLYSTVFSSTLGAGGLRLRPFASEDDKIEVEHMLEQCELKISKLLSLTAPLEDVSDRQRRMDDAASVRFVKFLASLAQLISGSTRGREIRGEAHAAKPV